MENIMYIWKKENSVEYWEFDGDFEKYLLKIGVDIDHVKKMKSKIMKKYDEALFKNVRSSIKGEILIPLSKVIGTNRCTPNQSVFENVRIMRDIERKHSSFEYFLQKAENDYQSCLRYFQELNDSVYMLYIRNTDEYFLCGNGNHRTLSAMLLGAENILAKITQECDLDIVKYQQSEIEKDFYNKYGIEKIQKVKAHELSITFVENGIHYIVSGFDYDPELTFEEVISYLSTCIDKDLKTVSFLQCLPTILRKILLSTLYSKRKRIDNYLHKKTNPTDQSSIRLYNLCSND